MADFSRRDERTVLRMRVLSGAFLPRYADGSDHRFSWNETTRLSWGTIFRAVALVDDRIALFRASTVSRIGTARRWIERGATSDLAREWSAANLFSASCGWCWRCCCELCRRRCADAGQVARAIYVARLHALGAARASARDLLTRHAFLGFTGAYERRGERESKCDKALTMAHDEGEITTESRGFLLLRRCFRSWCRWLFRRAVRALDRVRCRYLSSHVRAY